jgi:hypothetical protein
MKRCLLGWVSRIGRGKGVCVGGVKVCDVMMQKGAKRCKKVQKGAKRCKKVQKEVQKENHSISRTWADLPLDPAS